MGFLPIQSLPIGSVPIGSSLPSQDSGFVGGNFDPHVIAAAGIIFI